MSAPLANTHSLDRRELLLALAASGVGTEVFHRALLANEPEKPVQGKTLALTVEAIQQAEWVAGIQLSEEDRKSVLTLVRRFQQNAARLRGIALDNGAPLPLVFQPAMDLPCAQRSGTVENPEMGPATRPAEDELAFLSVAQLAALLRSRKVSSVELTRLYLRRLTQFDPLLQCVVTLTEKTALEQAERADREIAAGHYRGPLHGVPWGAKDLIAYPGYPTTWGAEAYREQVLPYKATVARRLEEAGAVLLAKLSLGALAMGDRWFKDRMTRNPWDPTQGSSGSSAGSASAVAAGLVGFAIGSETLGSIVSPSRVCGTSGLRPTFGRVSRHGCMTLCWSMDKLGPMARSIEDCALIFGAIHGRDGLDASAVDRPFSWPCRRDLTTLRVGYFKDRTPDRVLKRLGEDIGVRLVPIELPSRYPINDLTVILYAEAAAVFDEFTRQGKQIPATWKTSFQGGQFISASTYLRANRVRGLIMRDMAEVMEKVDLYVGGDDLVLTNYTGHPCVVLPDGFRRRGKVEVPSTVTFTGRLFGETELLAVAHAYQRAGGFHLRHPQLEVKK